MQIRPFIDILPSLYEHWGTTAMQPKAAETFREILEKVEQPTTANFLQLLTSAAAYLEPGEVICEVGCWYGANLIGVLADHPDRLAYGVDFFSTQAEVAENKIKLLQRNLENFGVAEQVCFSHQTIDDFFADLRDIETEDKFGLYVYNFEPNYRQVLMGLLLSRDFLADQALIFVNNTDCNEVKQAVTDFLSCQPNTKIVLNWQSIGDSIFNRQELVIIAWDNRNQIREIQPIIVNKYLTQIQHNIGNQKCVKQIYDTNTLNGLSTINQLLTRPKQVTLFKSKRPIILVDGVFFQLYQTGITRVWLSLLEEWKINNFVEYIVVLDRDNTMPKINGIRYRTIHPYDYNNTGFDKRQLQQICEEEKANLLISTYYTTPLQTSSVFMAYDMIPEVLCGTINLSEPMWREKHYAIHHASSYIAISYNTAKDLKNFFPAIPSDNITVAHCGVSTTFTPGSESEIKAFRRKYEINKPYFLLGGLGGYKNTILFFQAFVQLAHGSTFAIIATGPSSHLLHKWYKYANGATFYNLQLSDRELRLAYSGAIALVYPSKYEGFGMPVLEAMACGCPVITTPNASLPEVGGNAVIYVNDNDVAGMVDALRQVLNSEIRQRLVQAGLKQCRQFSWSTMAEKVQNVLLKVAN
jgi:glycosyltransferase involved in cell wall biosynthesis